MLNLQLREEFKGVKMKGATIDLSHDKAGGISKRPAAAREGISRQLSREREAATVFSLPSANSPAEEPGSALLRAQEVLLQQELQQELQHRGVAAEASGYESRLVA